MNILCVCSGNTCRSPMAAAYIRSRRPDLGVASAGLYATPGQPMAAEAHRALLERGIDPGEHASRLLDAEGVGWADLVLTMTADQAREARARHPAAASRIMSLGEWSGGGGDVTDPVGRGPAVYRQVLDRIVHLVDRGLAGMGPSRVLFHSDMPEPALLQTLMADAMGLGHAVALLPDRPRSAEEVLSAFGRAFATAAADLGVLVAPTGIGTMMAAGAHPGVKAVLATGPWLAEQARKWNGANLLILPHQLLGEGAARAVLDAFLRADAAAGRERRNG